jgi:hypothetical protein
VRAVIKFISRRAFDVFIADATSASLPANEFSADARWEGRARLVRLTAEVQVKVQAE